MKALFTVPLYLVFQSRTTLAVSRQLQVYIDQDQSPKLLDEYVEKVNIIRIIYTKSYITDTILLSGLSRDYWMDDENCKECYDCKSIFTAWRRKHHCRICGMNLSSSINQVAKPLKVKYFALVVRQILSRVLDLAMMAWSEFVTFVLKSLPR